MFQEYFYKKKIPTPKFKNFTHFQHLKTETVFFVFKQCTLTKQKVPIATIQLSQQLRTNRE